MQRLRLQGETLLLQELTISLCLLALRFLKHQLPGGLRPFLLLPLILAGLFLLEVGAGEQGCCKLRVGVQDREVVAKVCQSLRPRIPGCLTFVPIALSKSRPRSLRACASCHVVLGKSTATSTAASLAVFVLPLLLIDVEIRLLSVALTVLVLLVLCCGLLDLLLLARLLLLRILVAVFGHLCLLLFSQAS